MHRQEEKQVFKCLTGIKCKIKIVKGGFPKFN